MFYFFKKRNAGFTLIEVLLVVALLGVIASIGAPVFNLAQGRNDLLVAQTLLVSALRRAEVLATASEADSAWGIRLNTGSIVIFRGDSYLTRNVSFDEIYNISDSITVGPMNEIVFSKLNGFPDKTGTITLASNNNETKQVIINEKGMVDF